MDEKRDKLAALAQALRDLHKSLVASVQSSYEREHGRVAGPNVLLQLLLQHPEFAWLRPVSRLMAEVDEQLDDDAPPISAAALAETCGAIERLISDQGDDNPFTAPYLELLQNDADVLVAHAGLRKKLGG